MSHALQVFEEHAGAYDPLRRKLVPCFDDFYGAAVDAIRLATDAPKRVLDLGAGTGMLSAFVSGAYPAAELVLVDGSPAMLDQARETLGEGAAFHVADLRDPLPAGPFCAVVSALAIHHLADEDKASLYARAYDALAPGGVFVNAEQVLGPTPRLDAFYLDWHRTTSLSLGATEEDWAGAMGRMEADVCATAADQLGWLRDAGFTDVDAIFSDRRFAVLVGRRPA